MHLHEIRFHEEEPARGEAIARHKYRARRIGASIQIYGLTDHTAMKHVPPNRIIGIFHVVPAGINQHLIRRFQINLFGTKQALKR